MSNCEVHKHGQRSRGLSSGIGKSQKGGKGSGPEVPRVLVFEDRLAEKRSPRWRPEEVDWSSWRSFHVEYGEHEAVVADHCWAFAAAVKTSPRQRRGMFGMHRY